MIKDTRKVKPYPHVPPEFAHPKDEVDEKIDTYLIWAIRFFVAVFVVWSVFYIFALLEMLL